MPGGDGKGPPSGSGPGTGRGRGGGGAPGTGRGTDPEGICVCPSCGTTCSHQRGTPCTETKCPQCGKLMIRR